MSEITIGTVIVQKRKELGYTQQALAEKLHVSFQAVSKWENGSACPEITLLPELAKVLGTSVDTLLGYRTVVAADYEERYQAEEYFWGLNPNYLCYEIMKLRPPVKPLRVLDMGCGEGKDAVFLAKNGYLVTAFDQSEAGLEKGRKLAEKSGVYVDFLQADINDFTLKEQYDIIFCSGVFHYVKPEKRAEIVDYIKKHTVTGGLNVLNVFVEKPYLKDKERKQAKLWKTGELFNLYHDWMFHNMEEFVFDCNSGGVPHKHCMDVMIAEKMEPLKK